MCELEIAYVIWKLSLDDGVVSLAEIQLGLFPRRVAGYDEGESAAGLDRVRHQQAVHAELAEQRGHVAEQTKTNYISLPETLLPKEQLRWML